MQKEVGDKCKRCGEELVLEVPKEAHMPKKRKYWRYTHYLKCNRCGKFYYNDKYKITIRHLERTPNGRPIRYSLPPVEGGWYNEFKPELGPGSRGLE